MLHSYKHYVTIFAITGNENRMGCSPDQFFPVWRQWSGNETSVIVSLVNTRSSTS